MRKYVDNRDNQMIGDAVGELEGKIAKGTLDRDNCGRQYYGNLTEPKLPAVTGADWYLKKDVTGMPSYGSQKGRGSPRVIILVNDKTASGKAYFSPHYESFEELDAGFFKRAITMRDMYSKLEVVKK